MFYSNKELLMLDGSVQEVGHLEQIAKDDEQYYGYLGKAALSSSSIKMLLQSPKTYHYVTTYGGDNNSKALLIGKLFHLAVLEPHKMDEVRVIDVQSRATKAFKEAAAEGGEVITSKEEKDIRRLQDAMLRNEKVLSYLKGADFEIPRVDALDGMPFRAKADILQGDHIIDLKTTSDLNAFKYSAYKYGYDIQCYIYCNLFGVPPENFHFVAIDKGSLDIGVYHCSREFYDSGKKRTQKGIDLYKKFFVDGIDLDSYFIEETL
jgi:hypothetical protein